MQNEKIIYDDSKHKCIVFNFYGEEYEKFLSWFDELKCGGDFMKEIYQNV